MSRRARYGVILGVLMTVAALVLAQSGGDYTLNRSTIDNGGGRAVGGAYALEGSIGQPDAGRHTGGAYALEGGFIVGAAVVASPTETPTSTPTPTLTFTPNADELTATAGGFTLTPSNTPTSTATNTLRPTSTPTPTPTPTLSPTPTEAITVPVEGEILVELPPTGDTIPIIRWLEPILLPDWYQIIILDTSDNVLADVWFPAADIACPDRICEISLDSILPFGLDDGGFNFFVNFWTDEDGDGEGTIEEVGAVGIEVPTDRGPIDATYGRVIITFEDDPAKQWVRVWIGTAGTFEEVPHFNRTNAPGWYERESELNCNGAVCRILTQAHPTSGSYVIYLQFWDGTNLSAWTGPFDFEIGFDRAAFPADLAVTVTDGRPTFTWTAAPNATWYELYIGRDAGADPWPIDLLQWYSAITAECGLGGVACTITPDVTLTAGVEYVWYIRPWGPGGFPTGTIDDYIAGSPFTP